MTRINLLPADDIVAATRAVTAASIVVVIAPGRDPIGQAIAEAAVAPLAIERAPAARVNAVVATGSDPAAVAAAAAFLDAAASTTGQILRVT